MINDFNDAKVVKKKIHVQKIIIFAKYFDVYG
jgi:hypothetical protein